MENLHLFYSILHQIVLKSDKNVCCAHQHICCGFMKGFQVSLSHTLSCAIKKPSYIKDNPHIFSLQKSYLLEYIIANETKHVRLPYPYSIGLFVAVFQAIIEQRDLASYWKQKIDSKTDLR